MIEKPKASMGLLLVLMLRHLQLHCPLIPQAISHRHHYHWVESTSGAASVPTSSALSDTGAVEGVHSTSHPINMLTSSSSFPRWLLIVPKLQQSI